MTGNGANMAKGRNNATPGNVLGGIMLSVDAEEGAIEYARTGYGGEAMVGRLSRRSRNLSMKDFKYE